MIGWCLLAYWLIGVAVFIWGHTKLWDFTVEDIGLCAIGAIFWPMLLCCFVCDDETVIVKKRLTSTVTPASAPVVPECDHDWHASAMENKRVVQAACGKCGVTRSTVNRTPLLTGSRSSPPLAI